MMLIQWSLPVAGGGRRGDGDAPLLLLGHPVHGGRAFVDLTDLVVAAGVEEDPLGRGGLARVDVGHDPDVPGPAQRTLSDGGFLGHDHSLWSFYYFWWYPVPTRSDVSSALRGPIAGLPGQQNDRAFGPGRVQRLARGRAPERLSGVRCGGRRSAVLCRAAWSRPLRLVVGIPETSGIHLPTRSLNDLPCLRGHPLQRTGWAPRLPAVVGEGLVGLGHLVQVFLALHGRAEPVGRVEAARWPAARPWCAPGAPGRSRRSSGWRGWWPGGAGPPPAPGRWRRRRGGCAPRARASRCRPPA